MNAETNAVTVATLLLSVHSRTDRYNIIYIIANVKRSCEKGIYFS